MTYLMRQREAIKEMVKAALLASDREVYWENVLTLRGLSRQEIEEVAKLSTSIVDERRKLGRYLQEPRRPNRHIKGAEAMAVLLSGYEERPPEPETSTLEDEVDAEIIEGLSLLRNHPKERIRFQAASELVAYDDDRATDALITLSTDASDQVRSMATTWLSVGLLRGYPDVRQALVARLSDHDRDIQAEAIAALASVRDQRVIEPLLLALQGIHQDFRYLDAARDMGDPRLYDALVAHRGQEYVGSEMLEEACAACRPAAAEHDMDTI